MTEWNKWREDNPKEKIWLQGAVLKDKYLNGFCLHDAHLKGAKFNRTHLEKSVFIDANLENAIFYQAHLQGANFRTVLTNGATSFWGIEVDRKTDFRGVGLDACRIDEKTKYLLAYNRRRMNCEDWYKEHPRLAWPAKAFFWISDYAISTWRIIKTFFIMAICFAVIYYLWGAVDYYLVGVTHNPGIVANLFVDQQQPVLCWLVPLRSLYFSIVTMTTLGFGDMYANTNNYWLAAACGHLLLGLQVLLGYVLLGALVTRFGVLFTSGLISGQFSKEQEEPQK